MERRRRLPQVPRGTSRNIGTGDDVVEWRNAGSVNVQLTCPLDTLWQRAQRENTQSRGFWTIGHVCAKNKRGHAHAPRCRSSQFFRESVRVCVFFFVCLCFLIVDMFELVTGFVVVCSEIVACSGGASGGCLASAIAAHTQHRLRREGVAGRTREATVGRCGWRERASRCRGVVCKSRVKRSCPKLLQKLGSLKGPTNFQVISLHTCRHVSGQREEASPSPVVAVKQVPIAVRSGAGVPARAVETRSPDPLMDLYWAHDHSVQQRLWCLISVSLIHGLSMGLLPFLRSLLVGPFLRIG